MSATPEDSGIGGAPGGALAGQDALAGGGWRGLGRVFAQTLAAARAAGAILPRSRGVERFGEAQRRLGALTRLPPHVVPIAVGCVVGSADAAKAASLRRDFLPRRHGAQDSRYQDVERAMRAGTPLPAIEVYALGGAYYVVDGHHRVAAARALGQLYLDALVHEFPLAGQGVPHARRVPASAAPVQQPAAALCRSDGTPQRTNGQGVSTGCRRDVGRRQAMATCAPATLQAASVLAPLLTAALLGGVLLSAARPPAPPPPVYALSAVRAGLLQAPGRWIGRTVRVRAVAGNPCVSWMGGANPACISWQPALLDAAASSATQALPFHAASPAPLLAALRRLPLARWLVGTPPQIRWGTLSTYRVQLLAAPSTVCGLVRCYAALLLDTLPMAL